MKTCNACGERKPLTDFSPDTQNRDRRKGKCRACVVQRQREDRAAHPEKERAWVAANKDRVLASKRAYRERNHEKLRRESRERRRRTGDDPAIAAQRAAKARAEDRKKRAERDRIQQEKYPGKHCARVAVYQAVKSGRLIRPDACSKCGRPCKPQAHHHRGYAREHRLDVTWVCSKCHGREHRAEFDERERERAAQKGQAA